nr:MAG TPA: Receptor Binding Protein [Caudoviricetes sp.]
MIGFPFDSHVTFESDGTPVYDRAITSAPLRKLIAKLLTDGILPNPSTNLQVEAGSGMNVVVNPGFAICAGGLKLEENQRTLAIQAADSNYDRIDTVVLRWNDNDSERICDLYIVEGIPAASPLRPELTRTESIWELGLADLFVNKNSSAISNQRITDTRYETARCGIISAISEFDTTTLYQQVQADLAGFKASEQADFITWFNDIKGQLSEDAAGNLQKQIGTLESLKTEVKNNLVNALNWVVDKTSGVIAKLGSADISKIGDGTVTGAIVNNKEAIEDVSQSLTNLKNPITGDKGILVKSDSPLPNDYLLVYTIQSTDAIYSGGYVDINGVRVAQLTAQRANCALTIVGSVRGFKGDVVTFNNSNFGGSISVYAYK